MIKTAYKKLKQFEKIVRKMQLVVRYALRASPQDSISFDLRRVLGKQLLDLAKQLPSRSVQDEESLIALYETYIPELTQKKELSHPKLYQEFLRELDNHLNAWALREADTSMDTSADRPVVEIMTKQAQQAARQAGLDMKDVVYDTSPAQIWFTAKKSGGILYKIKIVYSGSSDTYNVSLARVHMNRKDPDYLNAYRSEERSGIYADNLADVFENLMRNRDKLKWTKV